MGFTFSEVTRSNWQSFLYLTACVFLSFPPSVPQKGKFWVCFYPWNPSGAKTWNNASGHWASAALLARVEVNKPHRTWLKEFIHSGRVVSGRKQCLTLWMLPLGNVRKCTVTQTALYVVWLSFKKPLISRWHWFTAKQMGEQNVLSDTH